MKEYPIIEKNKISYWDWLLIFGAVLSPMTGFRIWKIGPSELLCFIWACRYLLNRNTSFSYVLKFLSIFLFSMLIGTLICMMIAPKEVRLSSWPTWIFLAIISCSLYGDIHKNQLEYNIVLFDRICSVSVIWYSFLFLYSVYIGKSFLGAPLLYYSRFSGGGTNPHQVAVLLSGIIFWILYMFLYSGQKRLYYLICFCVSSYLMYRTESSTGIASVIIGIFVTTILFTIQIGYTRQRKSVLITLEIILFITIILLFHSKMYQLVYEWVSDDPNGMGRFRIWSSFWQAFRKSPIFGLGPGTHALSYGNLKEFHNSYLEILAASGIVGFLSFLLFTVKSVGRVLYGDMRLFPIIVSIYGYSMAGFAVRRLIYWIVIIFIIVLSEQMINEKQYKTYR